MGRKTRFARVNTGRCGYVGQYFRSVFPVFPLADKQAVGPIAGLDGDARIADLSNDDLCVGDGVESLKSGVGRASESSKSGFEWLNQEWAGELDIEGKAADRGQIVGYEVFVCIDDKLTKVQALGGKLFKRNEVPAQISKARLKGSIIIVELVFVPGADFNGSLRTIQVEEMEARKFAGFAVVVNEPEDFFVGAIKAEDLNRLWTTRGGLGGQAKAQGSEENEGEKEGCR